MKCKRIFICGLAALLSTGAVQAVINPALQPDVYFTKYDNVLVLRLDEIDADAGVLSCAVVEVLKGAYQPQESIEITFAGVMKSQVAERVSAGVFEVGKAFPVFAGKPSRRKSKRQVRMYFDEFFVGEVLEPGRLQIGVSDGSEKDSEGRAVNTLAGIYCGMTGELIQMLKDMAAGSDYYPRKAYVKFKPDMLISQLQGSVEGAAMFDLNGDGMEDLVACSPMGDRVFLQVEPMQFSDATEKLGITSASVSCSAADVDCDGLADLMLGSTIYRGVFDQTYRLEKTDWLNVENAAALKSASFVELNGDGFPDVVISYEGGGLQALLNPGGAGEFAALSAGLPDTGNGYIVAGDWNGDARTDLFYSEGRGHFLVQDENGGFQSLEHDIDFSFRTGVDEVGKTGAGIFMPTYRQDRMDLVVPIEKDWLIIENRDGVPTDTTRYGNEISEGSDYHLATVYADLNVDGYMDIYTVCDQRKENRYIINRGYGSYMHAKVHVDEKPLFKGPAHGSGGRSLAVGDVNDDGAPDLLIGNESGQVFLIINDTLSMRVEGELLTKDEQRLLHVALCSVRVLGPKGVVGAKVRLLDESGNAVCRKDLGGNTATGCSSPDTVCFAVRRPGKYTVNVEYADGHVRNEDVELIQTERASIVVERGDADDAAW
ncbi:FG-GAP repeat domain-containing protein [Pontiella agarivorans]|uniref:VCBS repeat-containing protein n=1 Tax=Pontiella agarivorans TaxID=3038953 RepID=A0ABU5MYQ2_9BACT|nr:VCBS repeat-containing protein [Pontiella agarivorans]MDZ8119298.1 VCBS repeat-containing protein [Pontiella agarivorans]